MARLRQKGWRDSFQSPARLLQVGWEAGGLQSSSLRARSLRQSRSMEAQHREQPLDNYAYCYSLNLDTVLRDYEIELTEATRQYESECQKEVWRSGWLKPQDFCFSGKGSQDWVKRREGASYRKNEVVVPVRLSNARFRGKSAPAVLDGSRPLPCAIVG